MAVSRIVKQYKYASRVFDFHCVVNHDGVPIFAPSMFLFEQAKKGLKPKSTRAYSFDLSKFFSALEQTESNVVGILGRDFRDVSDLQMTGYLDGVLKRQLGLKDITIERHIVALSSFYEFSYRYGLISKRLKFSFKYGEEDCKTTVMQGLTTKLHETYFNEGTFKTVVLANLNTSDAFELERDRLALMLGYHGGFRTEELIIKGNLCTKKLRKLLPFERNRVPKAISLKVKGKGGKTRGIQLTVEVTTALYDFLWGRAKDIKTCLMCRKNGRDLIDETYGTALFRLCINTYLAKTSLSADDVNVWIARTFHTLRKCFATNAVMYCHKTGIDPIVFVTQWMGHSDPDTTNIYIFYDALLNQRLDVLKDLNLQGTSFSQTYRKKIGKDND
jgi:integrase